MNAECEKTTTTTKYNYLNVPNFKTIEVVQNINNRFNPRLPPLNFPHGQQKLLQIGCKETAKKRNNKEDFIAEKYLPVGCYKKY
jgi:hypothetical protein